MLRRYREELQRRAVEPDDGVRSHVRIQGLESYNFKLNPTYVAKFALDSKTIQLAEASDSTSKSLRSLSVHSAEDWAPPDDGEAPPPPDDGDFGFATTHADLLPSPAAADDARSKHAHDVGRAAKRGSVWVEEREPDPHEMDLYHTEGGARLRRAPLSRRARPGDDAPPQVHHAHHVDLRMDHTVSERTKRRSSLGPAWHERWARDEEEGRRSLQSPTALFSSPRTVPAASAGRRARARGAPRRSTPSNCPR